MNTNTGIPKGSLCPDLLVVTLCRPSDQTFYSILSHLILFFRMCFNVSSREPTQQRVKKWGFSLEEALKDPAGRDQFLKFLESEFSSENLR